MKAICLFAISTLLCSCATRELTSSEGLEKRLRQHMDKGEILIGHQDDLFYGHSWKVSEDETLFERSDIKEVCGQYPMVLGIDLGGIELGAECNLDGNRFDHIRAAALKHAERGGIITISWHIRNPFTGGDSWDVSSKEAVKSVLEGGCRHELFLSWLDAAADYISGFTDAEGNLIPIIFRPWHEHTGSWFWWGEGLCSADEYKALWKLTYDYLSSERGLDNLLWSYSPGAGNLSAERIGERYPGDNMVDLLGLDVYQYGSSEDFRKELLASASEIAAFAEARNKLYALTEIGYEGIPEENWWTEVVYPAIKELSPSPVYVLFWRNAWDKEGHFYAPYPGQVSADDFCAFAAKDDIILN